MRRTLSIAIVAAALGGPLPGCVATVVDERPAAATPVPEELSTWQKVSNVATAPFRLAGAAIYYPLRFLGYDAWVGLYDLMAGDAPEVEALRAATTPAERAAAARRAAAAGRREVIPDLVAWLDDRDGAVRAAAVDGLERLHAREATPQLLQLAMEHRTPGTAIAAAEALGAVGGHAAWPVLAARLRAPRDALQAVVAAQAAGRLRSAPSLWALIQALHDQRAPVRRQVAWALGQLRDRRAAPFLLPLLQDDAAEVQAAAAVAIGRCGDDTAAPRLRRMLADRWPAATEADAFVALAAVAALGRLRVHEAVPALRAMAEAPAGTEAWSGPLRAAAVHALGRLGAAEVRPVLVALLRDRDARVSRTAGVALGELHGLDELLAGMEHELARAREAAAIGLGRLGGPQAAQALWDHGSHDQDGVVRHASAMALLAMEDRRGLDLLVDEVARAGRGLEARAAALGVLRDLSGLDHGLDPQAWRDWRHGQGRTVDLSRYRYHEG